MEKHNFKIDAENNTVLITVSSKVFPKPAVLRAAYHFIDDGKVIVDGDENSIIVTLIPNEKTQEPALEELAYEFNIQLISSFVEEEESRKHAGTREAMFKAALSPPRPFPPKPSQENSPKENN